MSVASLTMLVIAGVLVATGVYLLLERTLSRIFIDVKVDREARRLAGYRYGRQIADDFLTQLGQGEEQVARWLEAENDPRLNEIVSHLNHVVEEARIR